MKNKSGVILITVLWILLLLALFALGMGRVSSGEMALLKISMGRARAYAAARSGVLYAEQFLVKKPTYTDRWGMAGVALLPEEQQKTFSGMALGDGTYFDVGMPQGSASGAFTPEMVWGVMDETGRLNVNMVEGLSGVGARVFRNLVEEALPGYGDRLTNALSHYRWGEEGKAEVHRIYFLEELMLLGEFTPFVFKKLKPFLTVYPYASLNGFRVNMYTASMGLVRAVFKGAAEAVAFSGDSNRDAASFLACREEAFKTAKANAFCATPAYVTAVLADAGIARSGIYRIRSVGVDPPTKMRSVIEAVVSVSGNDLKELAWHRE